MNKQDWKLRAQWGYFKSAFVGLAIGMLIAPGVSDIIKGYENGTHLSVKEKVADCAMSVADVFAGGDKVKVLIDGEVFAVARNKDEAIEAVKTAGLQYNKDGIKPVFCDISYEAVDPENEKDKAIVKKFGTYKKDKLTDELLGKYESMGGNNSLAYAMRIDDTTITVKSFEDVVSVLEETQSAYDTNNEFQVKLKTPASKNVAMYEVEVDKKTEDTASDTEEMTEETTSSETQTEEQAEEQAEEKTEADTENSEETIIPDDESKPQTAGEPEAEGTETATDAESSETAEEGDGTGEEATEEATTEENIEDDPAVKEAFARLSTDDGIKYVGFSDKIEVVGTYVNNSIIKDRATAYTELTNPVDEPGIYVVVPGDCLSIIAEKVGMSVDDIKALNDGIENDDDIYYDDRLNIVVPTPPVEVLVEKKETYSEKYYADVQYQDDDSMFIGETSVVQEGTPGVHTVTDMVTYKGENESSRQQLDEVVEVAAVAEIVLRGTKSQPTYMFPLTNWEVTSNFGYRWGRLHAGTDVKADVGTTVRASRAGKVTSAGWIGGYGNCVIIDHGDGVQTRYGHLSQVLVSVGQYVEQGEQIALSGNTGRSTGPHLHFEIRINGEPVDPLPYLYQ
ncbi:MAG: peptidoglycan DD-metalloendopeptidase family protein [Lachnospiraceae bacterium]|nr:peptidoglycan DD-metalloendopeptidase family protein [Lachnospiraceae bacterium]